MNPRKWNGPFGYPDTRRLIQPSVASFWFRHLKEKRWCYMGILHPDIIFGCAVIHLGYLCSAFAFAFDRNTGKKIEKTIISPLPGRARMDRNPEYGRYTFKSVSGIVNIRNRTSSGFLKLKSRVQSKTGSLEANCRVLINPKFSPMHFLMPMQQGQKAFTTKAAGLPVEGSILFNNNKIKLDPKNTFAIFDWTHGNFPRETFWNWACGAGWDENGNAIGFNFSRGVYQYGQTENTVWINGHPYAAASVDFCYDKKDRQSPWLIKTRDNQIHLKFHPEGSRDADDNFIFVKSRFIQNFGRFEGQFSLDGSIHSIQSVTGVTEEHFAKW